MKKFLVAALLVCLAIPAIAQNKPTVYVKTLTATGVTTTAVNTRGYDKEVTFPLDLGNYWRKTMIIKFAKTTDTVRVQGRVFADGDTTWCDIPVTWKKLLASSPGAGGFGMTRDTTAIRLSPVGLGSIADYGGLTPGRTPMFELPPGFYSYRVVSGVNDTGGTLIRVSLIPSL